MSYNLLDTPTNLLKLRSKNKKSLPPLLSKSPDNHLAQLTHLDSIFLFNHKFNQSWNVEKIKSFEGTGNIRIISLESELDSNHRGPNIPVISEKRRELKGFLEKCNGRLIDSMISKKDSKRILNVPKLPPEKKRERKVESLQSRTKRLGIKPLLEIAPQRQLSRFDSGFFIEGSTPKLRLSHIKPGNDKKNAIKIQKLKNFEAIFLRFLRKSKFEEKFKESFLKHIVKLAGFRERKLEKEANVGKMDQKVQESILNHFRKQNEQQMDLENRRKIDALREIGSIIDQEISLQDETLESLMKSFKDMMNSKEQRL